MMLMGPFQLEIFYDSVVKLLCYPILKFIQLMLTLSQHLTPADSFRNPTFSFGILHSQNFCHELCSNTV